MGAGKSIHSYQEVTEGCLTKLDGKPVVSRCGTRAGADGALSGALRPATEKIAALESLDWGYVVGLLKAKTEIPDYNFCRIHSSIRVTPAMESGLTDHVWELEKMIAA